MNEMIREALVGAIHEIAASSTLETFADFVSVVKQVREELVLTYMSDEYAKRNVWPLIRKEIDLTTAVINATANFCLSIDDVEAAITAFANKAICFQAKSQIVDDDLMGKTVYAAELAKTLNQNHWLFFILFASTQIYLVNSVGAIYIPTETPTKGGSNGS